MPPFPCAIVAPQVTAFLDGALAPREAADVAAHLAECAKCRRVLQETTELLTALPLPEQAATVDLADALLAQIADEADAAPPPDEMARLRQEVTRLQAEVTHLRSQTPPRPVRGRPAPSPATPRLFPWAAPHSDLPNPYRH